jgi:hypothetical protein
LRRLRQSQILKLHPRVGVVNLKSTIGNLQLLTPIGTAMPLRVYLT